MSDRHKRIAEWLGWTEIRESELYGLVGTTPERECGRAVPYYDELLEHALAILTKLNEDHGIDWRIGADPLHVVYLEGGIEEAYRPGDSESIAEAICTVWERWMEETP